MDNIKQFLEAKKLQNPEDAALFILTAHMAQDEMRAMQAAFEQVCVAIDSTVKSGSYAYLDKRIRDRLMDALTAAAPFCKTGV